MQIKIVFGRGKSVGFADFHQSRPSRKVVAKNDDTYSSPYGESGFTSDTNHWSEVDRFWIQPEAAVIDAINLGLQNESTVLGESYCSFSSNRA